MIESGEKSIHVLPFDGNEDNWRMWSRQFLARAHKKGYKQVLLGKEVPPAEDDPTNDKKELETRKANNDAYTDLILSMSDDVPFAAVDEATTSDLPSGDAGLAWSNLVARFEPKTPVTMVTVKQKFSECKMDNSTQHPDEWIAKLETYRKRLIALKSLISDTDFMIHILTHLPNKYESTVEKLEDDLTKGTLTVTDLREKLRSKYDRITRNKRANDRPSNETALAAANMTNNNESNNNGGNLGSTNQYFKGRSSNC